MTVLDLADQVLVCSRLQRVVGPLGGALPELSAAAEGWPVPLGGERLDLLAGELENLLERVKRAADAAGQLGVTSN